MNRAHAERLSKAKSNEGGQNVEVLMEERDSLSSESKKLKKYVLFQQKRYEKRVDELNRNLQLKTDECHSTQKALDQATEAYATAQDTNKHLREQVSSKIAKMNEMRAKMEALDREVEVCRNAESINTDASKLRARINRKMRKCVRELETLAKVSKQMVEGDDPNLSMLLGVDPDVEATSESNDDELKRLNGDLEDLESAYKDISDLRQILTDKYAESFAENCNVQ